MHGSCSGSWERIGKRARCTDCRLTAMSMRSLELVDHEGLAALVDPTGLQQRFMDMTGLTGSSTSSNGVGVQMTMTLPGLSSEP